MERCEYTPCLEIYHAYTIDQALFYKLKGVSPEGFLAWSKLEQRGLTTHSRYLSAQMKPEVMPEDAERMGFSLKPKRPDDTEGTPLPADDGNAERSASGSGGTPTVLVQDRVVEASPVDIQKGQSKLIFFVRARNLSSVLLSYFVQDGV